MDSGLPGGWEIRHSKSRNLPYYFNAATSDSRWEPPHGTDSDKLALYMATHHSSDAPSTTASAKGDKIRAAHLLIKHSGSRRPSSWKEPNITRSKHEATSILLGHEARIRAGGPSLSDVAVTESDCSSARKGGDLGFFGRGEMQKPFEEAAYALQVGEMSGVVETDSGVHLIMRTA
ncbi:Peptidyl-prolyl cis/trans isomerase [Taphrina deformans PYCC 5710]|uniref:Peptidyl-prolyl cis-trans isomerase n=1 Tax=Taphrina deformans (strain PYCC 5710 / ATCC 11124 / CBS 356.35 / IMI 108563 / JCM 9778 / NBRC 8474) TaxID=1097556 RepID=R4X6L5_TAPDE|nr:Peptidyl-prolyl cis/trans isomerase [Taphrina deformans PYCC 5710]|eukprot:CCG80790.1 Peptidyl-prolyl cis/trans isomerase [Taphrina deformans PYCC 5710]